MKIKLHKETALQAKKFSRARALRYLFVQSGSRLSQGQVEQLYNIILNVNLDAVRDPFITFGVD